MFICELTYTAPLTTIDDLLDAHVVWVKAQHAAGSVIGWGRKVPRDGGFMFLLAPDRDVAEALVARNPFVAAGAATVRVSEFGGYLDPDFAARAMGPM